MSDLATLNRTVSLSSAAKDFFAYARAQAYGETKGNLVGEALRFAQDRGASPRVWEMIEKAAVTIGSMSGTWGAELAYIEDASRGFLALLPPYSAFDRLVADGAVTPLPLNKRLAKVTSAAVASYVGERRAKPLTRMSLSSEVMPPQKIVAMITYTTELLLTRPALVQDLFNQTLRNAVAKETDQRFLEIIAADTDVVQHASTGTSASAFVHDLTVALGSIAGSLGVGSRLYLIVPIAELGTLSLLRDNGGFILQDNKIGAITVIPTSASTSDAVLLDASAIGADAGIAVSKSTTHATIEEDDNPTATDYHTISLWQNNLVAEVVERYFGAVALRPESIAIITGINVTA